VEGGNPREYGPQVGSPVLRIQGTRHVMIIGNRFRFVLAEFLLPLFYGVADFGSGFIIRFRELSDGFENQLDFFVMFSQ
jgi:hypothetical protein